MGQLYHLQVGCGDASVIQANSGTFLVDCHRIEEHASKLPANKHLRGVFITHQHSDHYSGLEYLRKRGYKIDYLVYAPYERRRGDASVTIEEWNEFADHRDFFKRQGTELRAPFGQNTFEKAWWTNGDVKFWMLGPAEAVATSSTRELHDACLVFRADLGSRICLFTGDASDTNLQDVARVGNICGDILHASHHGSINGADLDFIKSAKADYTVISTESGVYQNVPHPTALRRYKDHTAKAVRRTDQDGTRVWKF